MSYPTSILKTHVVKKRLKKFTRHQSDRYRKLAVSDGVFHRGVAAEFVLHLTRFMLICGIR